MRLQLLTPIAAGVLFVAAIVAAQTPTDVQQPGTQPAEVTPPSNSGLCACCHSNIDPACSFCHPAMSTESAPWLNWQGSMMGHSSSDPMFWASLAVAEQEFNGAGDLCIRCHVPTGWLAGHATPSDGSALTADDFDGVTCELCHKLVNPDDSEHIGAQHAPFIANDGGTPKKAYRGSAMYVMWGGPHRLGPYSDAAAPHPWKQSKLHRSADLCATCHDVSNPITGDLAHNNGAPIPLASGEYSGVLGAPVTEKAAFLNEPHKYGVMQRTASEHRASGLDTLEVQNLRRLPVELRSGALGSAFDAAMRSSPDGKYVDGATRNFTCQSCHMQPVQGRGANLLAAQVRDDIPRHDLTGGNYWMGQALKWLDAQGRLRERAPFWPEQIQCIDDGAERARKSLRGAAGLTVIGDTLRIVNRTGHKLITGFSEGRRMWLRVRWYDGSGALLRTDGDYGAITAQVAGQPRQVETILAPNDPNTHVFEARQGMTQQWAQQLIGFGGSSSLPLAFDRASGAVTQTLGELAASAPGSEAATLHLSLNNLTLSDNRIPPYGLNYDEALTSNALPVPPTQFGNPGPGGVYQHWSDVTLAPPPTASRAEIELLYQPTSWEYMQFLYLANNGNNTSLASTGQDMLDAWFATGMAAPEVIARAPWGATQPATYCNAKTNALGCVPAIGWYGTPSASAAEGFQVVVRNLRNNRPGLMLYSRAGRAEQPFQGGTLCLAAPITRTPNDSSGGSSSGQDCSGGLSVDFNRLIASGIDPALIAGVTVNAQFWGRDPGFSAPNNATLSNALEFVIGP